MSLRTSFCDLPQNEQHSNSSGRLKFAIKTVVGSQLSVVSLESFLIDRDKPLSILPISAAL
jgi:hypothetical protein